MNREIKKGSNKNIHVIINPASAGGKTGAKQAEILKALESRLTDNYSLCVTGSPLEASSSSRKAILEGSELIIAVGGDGTVQETVNGFFLNGDLINPACQLGIIDSGTGHGFSQSLELPAGLESQIDMIRTGRTRSIDLGKITFSDGNSHQRTRYFINECQAGIGGEVVKRVQSKHKKWGGFLAFGAISLSTALRYPNRSMAVEIDGTQRKIDYLIGVVVGNGSCMAGGMKLIPHARMDDGLFDILLIHEQSIPQRLWNFPKIYSGRHLTSSRFSLLHGKRITLSSAEHVTLEADGEFLGSLPCSIEILPSIIQVKHRISATG